jgi:response regulator of citrate/malate metabolism
VDILIIEDNEWFISLVTQITQTVFSSPKVSYATTANQALGLIADTDLIITDFEFPDGGFLALLSTIQKESKKFILISADPTHVKIYDSILQIDALDKGRDFVRSLISTLKNQNLRR